MEAPTPAVQIALKDFLLWCPLMSPEFLLAGSEQSQPGPLRPWLAGRAPGPGRVRHR